MLNINFTVANLNMLIKTEREMLPGTPNKNGAGFFAGQVTYNNRPVKFYFFPVLRRKLCQINLNAASFVAAPRSILHHFGTE